MATQFKHWGLFLENQCSPGFLGTAQRSEINRKLGLPRRRDQQHHLRQRATFKVQRSFPWIRLQKKTGLLSYITGGSSSDSREERSRLMQVQRQQREAVQRCQRSSQSQQQNAGVWPASDVSSETEWHNLFTQVFIQASIKPVINGTTAVYQKFISDGKISISTCLPSRCASLITA